MRYVISCRATSTAAVSPNTDWFTSVRTFDADLMYSDVLCCYIDGKPCTGFPFARKLLFLLPDCICRQHVSKAWASSCLQAPLFHYQLESSVNNGQIELFRTNLQSSGFTAVLRMWMACNKNRISKDVIIDIITKCNGALLVQIHHTMEKLGMPWTI